MIQLIAILFLLFFLAKFFMHFMGIIFFLIAAVVEMTRRIFKI